MDSSKITQAQLEDIKELLKKQIELLEKIYFVFSKYDQEYLEEMEKEGMNVNSVSG
jgi:hypothetical protein